MISDCISNSIPPQMRILNMVIPILMQCTSGLGLFMVKNLCFG